MGTKPNVIKGFVLFTGAIIALIVSSCSATKISISVVHPPETPLSVPVYDIALVNRVGVSTANTTQYVNGEVYSQFNGVTDFMVEETFLKMKEVFNSNQYFNAFDTALSFIPKNGNFNGMHMPPNVSQRACAILKTDAIVTIEGYTADLDTDNQVHFSTPVERTYGTVRVPYFDGEQSVYMKMLFKVYLCKEGNGMVDSESDVDTQVSITASGSTPFELNANMSGASNVLVVAAHKIGIDYAEQIGPKTEWESRKIYSTGNDQMLEAYSLAKNGYWKQASDIWYLLATSNNKKIAGRSTYNLILANEAMSEFDVAMEMANRCITVFDMNEASDYLEAIKKRKKEVERLRKLFPQMII